LVVDVLSRCAVAVPRQSEATKPFNIIW